MSPVTTDGSVYSRERFELCERVLSAFLRSVGTSPVLFATLVLGKEFAASILLAQKLLSFPIGSLLNVMVLPLMIRPYRKREQLVRSILPHSIVILTLSLAGMTPIPCFDGYIQTYTVGAFVLVGVRLYCERLIYSLFLILRETKIWILTLFLLDCFVLLSLLNFHALALKPFYVLGALFFPTIVLGLFLLSTNRFSSAK